MKLPMSIPHATHSEFALIKQLSFTLILSPPQGGLNIRYKNLVQIIIAQFNSTNSMSFNQPQKVVMSGVSVLILMRSVLKRTEFCR
jgi:hypothetical protein